MVSVLRKSRQESYGKFEASLGDLAKLCLKQRKYCVLNYFL